MKKGFSIVVVILMVATMSHITVATHFCGGRVAGSKISLSGKLASCGMEGMDNRPLPSGTTVTNHCCEDVMTILLTDNNYRPSFSDIHVSGSLISKIFWITTAYTLYPETSFVSFPPKIRPPGQYLPVSAELPVLCVFRI